MKKVILFGSTGNLGKRLAIALEQQGYIVTAVVRNDAKRKEIDHSVHTCLVADVTNLSSLSNICDGFDIVVSALGKSVSPNDRSKPSFFDIDFTANSVILQEAVKAGVKKFVYVSAFSAEKYQHLTYFRVHHQFAEKLKASGINYTIVKPPALFSAFRDMIPMAKNGLLFTMGKGDKLTNPIYEGDLAAICVDAINLPDVEIEAGGKEVLSRHQINEIIQRAVAPGKKVRKLPLGLVKAGFPFLKLTAPNLYDKMAFFTEVMQHDTIAPIMGETKLDDYIRQQLTFTGTPK